jgi:hypothetical protein
MEAARLAGDTPSRPASAPPTDQEVQDCLTGTAQKEAEEADTSERHSNPETSNRQADTELEAESQPLLDPEEVTNRIEEVEIEDIGSHTVSDRNSLAWDDDQDLQSEAGNPDTTPGPTSTQGNPESTPDPIPAQGQKPDERSPAKRAAEICKMLMGTEYVRLLVHFKGDINNVNDRQLMYLAVDECKKQGINAAKHVPAIESFINKINEEVAKEAVRARTQELFGQPTMPDVNDPRPNPATGKESGADKESGAGKEAGSKTDNESEHADHRGNRKSLPGDWRDLGV